MAMLERLADPSGKDVVDIGCGGGALVRALAARGARVTGVEISDEQLAAAVDNDDGSGARYLIGRAEQLPLADASVDLAVFMRTLHHVPPADLLAAWAKLAAYCDRTGSCTSPSRWRKAISTRLRAWSRTRSTSARRSARSPELRWRPWTGRPRSTTTCGSASPTSRRVVSVDPARAERFDAREAELAETFARLGEAGERAGERCFLAPMRADVLRPVRPAAG